MRPAPSRTTAARFQPSLAAFAAYFLRLGAIGFGGPIALSARMQRDLVDERGWVSRERFRDGLALAQLAPGPLAAQLAIYLGWLRGGPLGATLVGIAFTLPSFLIVIALAALYLRHGGLPWIQDAFYGIGAAVIAIIARGALKLSRSTLHRDLALWLVCGVNAIATIVAEREVVWVFVASGVLMALVRGGIARRAVRATGAAGALLPMWTPWVLALPSAAANGTLLSIATFFASAGMFVFGSGLAIVPFLRGGVVTQHHWLTDAQFLDAVAVAMITPGPVVITVAFIGYLVAGPLGASAASAGIFLPCYLFVVIPAPYFRRFANNPRVKAFVDGVTAAATGAIAGAAFVLGRRALTEFGAAAIALATWLVFSRFKKLPEPLVIVAAGVVGLLVHRN